MSFAHLSRSVSALRARYGDTENLSSPALRATPSSDEGLPVAEKAGEVLLTPGQKVALLRLRGSDWSKAVIHRLVEVGEARVTAADYAAIVRLALAIDKGYLHVLTPAGPAAR